MKKNNKRTIFSCICTTVVLALLLSGCSPKYEKYRYEFYGTFDTVVTIVGYVDREKDFDAFTKYAQEQFNYYHQLFDRYHDYDGVVNIKSINDGAGERAVTVSEDLFTFLQYALDWCEKTEGNVNIALGPVLEIWHDYRERYANAAQGELPDFYLLEEANELTDYHQVVLDEKNKTVFLPQKGMSLDVGAVAKGYATEKVGQALYEMGFESFSISSGGNVRTFGAPISDSRSKWSISIANPNAAEDPNAEPIDFLYLNHLSVVTSGDYQRYYLAQGKKIHHIIDPQSLYPAAYYKSVTVITEDSGEADLLSTWLFVLPFDESKAVADQLGVQALWVLQDDGIKYTDGLRDYSKNFGNATVE